MIIFILIVLGLCFGSFVNALVYRLHAQSMKGSERRDQGTGKKAKKLSLQPSALSPTSNLSILRGRSICVHCHHQLAWHDLIPLLSWLSLKGKCRYCGKPISPQYPLVEAATAALFVLSYSFWPFMLNSSFLVLQFIVWLAILTLLIALFVYDIYWRLLPDKLTYIILGLAAVYVIITALQLSSLYSVVRDAILGLLCLGGLFYVLFQVSRGQWIGGGDVKLGFGLGLLAGSAPRALLLLFLSALIGSFMSVVLMALHRASRKAQVPYGPFLVVAAIIMQLFGQSILNWYESHFLFI